MEPSVRNVITLKDQPNKTAAIHFAPAAFAPAPLPRLFDQKLKEKDDYWDSDGTQIRELRQKETEESSWRTPDAWIRWDTEQHSTDESGLAKIFDKSNASDQDAQDRVMLLAKKYASESVGLDKEDHARLEMLNSTMDLKYPRYTEEDFRVLDEAEELLKEIDKIRGQ